MVSSERISAGISRVDHDYPMISRNHARLTRASGGRLILEDLDSVNGTAVSNPANRIKRAEVKVEDNVFFGSFKIRV